jgi:hypothetical protein
MLVRILAGPALAVALVAAIAPAARADFALVSEDLTLTRQDPDAHFSLTFNQAPNFATIGTSTTPVDSFQIEFDGTSTIPFEIPSDMTAVVRGDEIHVADNIRIRTPTGDGGPDSGGWGPVVGTVPFSLTGTTVSFDIPKGELGYTGGDWTASVFSLDAGSLTAQQTVTSVPTPPAFWGGLAGLAVVAGLSVRRTLIRRRSSAGHFVG